MDKLFYLIFFISFCGAYAVINITEVTGPDSIEYGSEEEVILDCDFVADEEEGVVLKWFYNGDIEVVYQWIPGLNKKGRALGRLKGHVDLNYTVTNDPNTKYRAMKIFNVTPDLSGNYTCRVSSFGNEESKTKQFIVFIPPESELNLTLTEENPTVICNVQGVLPEPKMDLYIEGENDARIAIENFTIGKSEEYTIEDESGLYNVTKIYILQDLSDLPNGGKFVCDLSIPGTDFFSSESLPYQTVEVTENPDEEENIWNLNDNSTSKEEYSDNVEGNAGIKYTPGLTLTTAVTTLLMLLCK